MEERSLDEEGVEGTDADQCMSSCSFWSLGLLLPASSRNPAGAGRSLRTRAQQQQQKGCPDERMCPAYRLYK